MKIKLLIITFLILIFSVVGQAQEITMFPSFWKVKYYEDRIEIDRNRFESLIMSEPESYEFLKKSNRHRNYSIAAIAAEFGFLIWYFRDLSNNNSAVVPAIGTLVTAGISLAFTSSSMNNLKESILTYNEKKTFISSINIGPTYNGLGMVLNF